MKIDSSQVSMTSSHAYESHASAKKTVMEVSVDGNSMTRLAAVYEASADTVSAAAQKIQSQQGKAREQLDALQTLDSPPQWSMSDFEDAVAKIKEGILEAMLKSLGGKAKLDPLHLGEFKKGDALDLRSPGCKAADTRSRMFGIQPRTFNGRLTEIGTTQAGTAWKRVTSESTTFSESEATTFQSQGVAVTADGRSIHFDVALNMSRSFTATHEAFASEEVILMDPLIINLDSDVTSLSGAKFQFDLDSDGENETISFAGAGSGFLALDSNGNGVIDDGSELFGTKSGDGFADLAAHDADGNGWIDENDAVYSKLRVWTKDAGGNDRLMNLKEANVGAIYLGSADTEFSLNDAQTNGTNGVIRKTGIYLKETGEAGTLSHVDLQC